MASIVQQRTPPLSSMINNIDPFHAGIVMTTNFLERAPPMEVDDLGLPIKPVAPYQIGKTLGTKT